jgi:large subunit ribosomal protein L23
LRHSRLTRLKFSRTGKTKNVIFMDGKIFQKKAKVHKVDGRVLLYPITTEKAIGMIEMQNKLVFVVRKDAAKPQIKEEMEKLFKVKVGSINTKITPKGVKHAYIKLKEGKADEIATKLKIV